MKSLVYGFDALVAKAFDKEQVEWQGSEDEERPLADDDFIGAIGCSEHIANGDSDGAHMG